jgi:hypothetical protein
MKLDPGYYRFAVDSRWLQEHTAQLREFFHRSGLLPVRITADHATRAIEYVVQAGEVPHGARTDGSLIRDAELHVTLEGYALRPKRPDLEAIAARIAAERVERVVDSARRLVYQSGANLATVQRNIAELAEALEAVDE